MKRLLPYRAKLTATVETRLQSLEGSQRPVKLFLVQTLGPTLFIVRQESTTTPTAEQQQLLQPSPPSPPPPTTTTRKYKVAIGNPQRCSCGARELCIHILFCMTKVLGVPKDNPLTWQRALVEREINDVCSGQVARAARAAVQNSTARRQQHTNFLRSRRSHSDTSKTTTSSTLTAKRKPIDTGDTCPVCLENLQDTAEEAEDTLAAATHHNLVYCKKGCGKNVHTACMLVWAEHQNDIKKSITCPLCRVDWGPLALDCLRNGGQTPKQRDRHQGVICANCPNAGGVGGGVGSASNRAIVGVRHRCLVCADYDLCGRCFTSSSVHAMHQFVCKTNSKGPWVSLNLYSKHKDLRHLLVDF